MYIYIYILRCFAFNLITEIPGAKMHTYSMQAIKPVQSESFQIPELLKS